MQCVFQSDKQYNPSRYNNTASEVVLGTITDRKCKERFIHLQLARDLGLQQKATPRLMMMIRTEMAKGSALLQGIGGADEPYVGCRTKKDYDRTEEELRKRGRVTMKDTVFGIVSRAGHVLPN